MILFPVANTWSMKGMLMILSLVLLGVVLEVYLWKQLLICTPNCLALLFCMFPFLIYATQCLPVTILDYEEFGNPRIYSYLDYILKYSPYDNICQGGCNPPLLVTASFQDSRVGFWEAAKWVAKIRDSTCSSCSCLVILKTHMVAGHIGEGRVSKVSAYEYAFLMKAMGISDQ